MRTGWGRLVAVATAAIAVAACGTTVKTGSSRATGGGAISSGNGGLAAPGSSDANSGGGDSSLTGGGSSAPATGGGATSNGGATPSGSGGVSGGTSSPGSSSSGGGGGSSPGVTASSIYIGIPYTNNGNALNAAAGAKGISTGDQQSDANAIIDDINKSGGLAGRKLVPVYANFNTTSTQTVDEQYQAICASLTQDHHVLAFIGQSTPAGRACFQKAGVAVLDSDLPTAGAAEFASDPSFIELGYPNLDRIAAEQVSALSAQNYFSPWNAAIGAPGTAHAKVGVLTFTTGPFARATANTLIPALTAAGYKPEVEYVGQINTAADYANEAAAVSSAELKFKTDGVDHVIMFDSNGSLSLFFMNDANSQGYFPRYGGHSGSAFQVLVSTGDVPAAEMNGAMGFGWIPGIDLPSSANSDNGPYSTPTRRKCLAVLKAHGITFPDPNAEGIALGYCDVLYLLQKALNPGPPVINVTTLVQAIEGTGSGFVPAGTFGETFGPGRHDGVSKAYYMQYAANCKCFQYVGSPHIVP